MNYQISVLLNIQVFFVEVLFYVIYQFGHASLPFIIWNAMVLKPFVEGKVLRTRVGAAFWRVLFCDLDYFFA
jgi:uncharacterized membrane protein (DUF441 family)